jgi:transcriptional regulator with XRE-family HTH domain
MPRSVQSRNVDHHIGGRLKATRDAMGWRRVDLAERIGLSDGELADIEAGKKHISPIMLFRSADALKVAIGSFFEDSLTIHSLAEKITSDEDFIRFLKMPDSLRLVRAFNAIDCDTLRSSLINTAEGLSQPYRAE